MEEPDEIGRDEARPLVEQLVVGMLAVGARRTPDDRAGGEVNRLAVEGDGLAIAFHVELLQVSGELGQVMVVGQHGMGLRTEEVVVPDA